MSNTRSAEFINTEQYLKHGREMTNRLLDQYLPAATNDPRLLHEAIRYSVLAGGKRLRPILSLASFEHCGGDTGANSDSIGKAMAAIEMVHTYSLIHDDLPCMDNDDLRRGIPTCHKKFGEAVAVLAGDALHDIAFGLLTVSDFPATVAELARAIGTDGMLGGQMADIEAEGKEISLDEIVHIHRRKTAALIACSVRIGAIMAGADRNRVNNLGSFGEKVGLAFQIIDDILDVEGDQDLMGKKIGADCKMKKSTYPGVVGLKQARKDADNLITEALAVFEKDEKSHLREVALFIGQRKS